MVKKIIFAVVVLVAGISTAAGQTGGRFEWAKGYGSREGAVIKGQVVDREGNLYILGEFRNGDTWDGEPLLPITPYGPYPDTKNVLIAKISPAGQMLWKKAIHANNGQNSLAMDIKLVGDTAIACFAFISLPSNNHYLFFLDTLYTGFSDHLVPDMEHRGYSGCAAFMMFDFEGNLQERHFLQVSFLDADGNDFLFLPQTLLDTLPSYVCFGLENPSFDIDHKGNIYLVRRTSDVYWQGEDNHNMVEYSTLNGGISAIKFWVDHRVVGITYIDGTPNQRLGSAHLLKFSPHFDTLLNDRFIVQHCTGIGKTNNAYLRMDQYENLYIFGDIHDRAQATYVIDSLQNLSIPITEANREKGYLIKFDTNLCARLCVSLEDSVIQQELQISNGNIMDIAFDYDSNLLIISANSGRSAFNDTTNYYSILTYRGIPLTGIKSDAFFLVINFDNGFLHSYGRVPAIIHSEAISSSHDLITSHHGRIFMQSQYVGGIRLPDTTIEYSRWADEGMGLFVFDYSGNLISWEDYSTIGGSNRVGPIAIKDSVLYLSNLLVTNATFGDIQVSGQGYFACVAKYVDTSFMTPYRGSEQVNISVAETYHELTLYPNPATNYLHINASGESVTQATFITMLGQRIHASLHSNTIDVSHLPQGIYLLEITTNSHQSHLKFIKQ